jgi:hypothetical protein
MHTIFWLEDGRWKDNIRTDLREIVWEDVDSIHLALDRDQWRALVNELHKSGEFLD